MVFQAAKRIAQLDAAHEGLVFGRLDLDAAHRHRARATSAGSACATPQRDSLLIDWRAPAAAVFYQATAAEPQGVDPPPGAALRGPPHRGRRRGRAARRRGARASDADLPIIGEGALMAQLSRARDRSMHSIVATIQAEQDKAIRAPGKGVVSISGGPGTGKTVVALHRAAYLLYSDRRRYESGGVLVVGPSGVFMRYIERVLPSLGETAVALRSLGEVVDGVRATRHDEPAVADVKGAARMAELMRRAARQQAPGSPTEFSVFWRDDRLVLDRGVLGRVRRQLMSQGRRNRQLPRVANALLDAMWRQVRGERGRERGREAFDDDMLSTPALRRLRRRVVAAARRARPCSAGWPTPRSSPGSARACVTPEEQRLLEQVVDRRAGSPSRTSPLLDELRYALGDVPLRTDADHDRDDTVTATEGGVDLQELTTASEREYAPTGRAWAPPTHRIEDDGFAHVLVDEAQDLTPMQWRMVGRRGRAASWTIVGDPAQSSWPVPAESAAGPRRGARGQAASTSSTSRPTTATRPRSTSSPRRTPSGSASTPTCPTPCAAPGEAPRELPDTPDLEAATRPRSPRSPPACRAPSASSCRSPGARRSTPGWRPGRSWPTTPAAPAPRWTRRWRRAARTGSWC